MESENRLLSSLHQRHIACLSELPCHSIGLQQPCLRHQLLPPKSNAGGSGTSLPTNRSASCPPMISSLPIFVESYSRSCITMAPQHTVSVLAIWLVPSRQDGKPLTPLVKASTRTGARLSSSAIRWNWPAGNENTKALQSRLQKKSSAAMVLGEQKLGSISAWRIHLPRSNSKSPTRSTRPLQLLLPYRPSAARHRHQHLKRQQAKSNSQQDRLFSLLGRGSLHSFTPVSTSSSPLQEEKIPAESYREPPSSHAAFERIQDGRVHKH